ncbi:hypothetical protein FBY03_102239 [Pseudomonas sp. SJZ079]|nr:hypothetical protein FBY03_102239 [Pseudomonas sp. SJZ079]
MIGSLALFGFLIGLMVGRLLEPDALRLERVEAAPQGLTLWFNAEPAVRAAQVAGAYVLRFESQGRERRGQLDLHGKPVNWRLTRDQRVLRLRFVAARPLRGEWRSEALDGRWRLVVSLEQE